MRTPNTPRGRTAAVVLTAVLVVLAGCSGGGGPAATNSSNATTGTANGTVAANATATSTTSSGSNGTTTDHGHDHSQSGSGNGTTAAAGADAKAAGTMTVLVGGSQIHLRGDAGPVTFGDARGWYTNETNVTVAEALEAYGVTLTAEKLAYRGTTYAESQANTTVSVRVNGESVDPTSHTLRDGDSVWIYVDAPNHTVNPPGEYLSGDVDHEHGTMTVVIDEGVLNLSKERYQNQDEYFHFEGGDGEHWHAHSWNVTLQYAVQTLGLNATADSFTYDGTTYVDGENASVTILVNGEPVDPATYRLKDGDAVRIVVETDA